MFTAQTTGAPYSPRCRDEAPGARLAPELPRVSFLGPKPGPPAPDVERESAERPVRALTPRSQRAPGAVPAPQTMSSLGRSCELLGDIKALSVEPRTRLRTNHTGCPYAVIQGHRNACICPPQFSPARTRALTNAPAFIHPYT